MTSNGDRGRSVRLGIAVMLLMFATVMVHINTTSSTPPSPAASVEKTTSPSLDTPQPPAVASTLPASGASSTRQADDANKLKRPAQDTSTPVPKRLSTSSSTASATSSASSYSHESVCGTVNQQSKLGKGKIALGTNAAQSLMNPVCHPLPKKFNEFLPFWDDVDIDGQNALKEAVLKGSSSSSSSGGGCSAESSTQTVLAFGRGFLSAETQKQLQEVGVEIDAKDLPPTSAATGGGFSARWNRFWFVALDKNKKRRCSGGDAFEVRMESSDAKVAVSRVMDLGNGVHEVHVFIRKPSKAYTVTIDPVFVVPPSSNGGDGKQKPPPEFRLGKSSKTNTDAGDNSTSNDDMKMGSVVGGNVPDIEAKSGSKPWCPARSFSNDSYVFKGADFSGGVEMVPRQVPCWEAVEERNRFRSGGWVRIPNRSGGPEIMCDGVHCSGPLHRLDSDGWVWASDYCIVHIYGTPAEATRIVAGQWVVGWGPSTMKQPMSNFVEYRLGGKVVQPVTMETIHHWPGPKKKTPGFFTYRQWDAITAPPSGTALASSRMSMVWGGCPAITAGPQACPKTTGMMNRDRTSSFINPVSPLLKKMQAEKAAESSTTISPLPAPYPTAVITDHFVWRFPLWDEQEFNRIATDTVEEFLMQRVNNATTGTQADSSGGEEQQRTAKFSGPSTPNAATKKPKKPLLIWQTGPPPIHSDGSRSCVAPPLVNRQRHFSFVIEDHFNAAETGLIERMAKGQAANENGGDDAKTPPLLFISRFDLLLPFHFTDEWVHFGLHYGATRGMCLTGIGHKQKYELAQCLRRTYPETMLEMLWLNAIAGWYGVPSTNSS